MTSFLKGPFLCTATNVELVSCTTLQDEPIIIESECTVVGDPVACYEQIRN